MSYSVTLGSLIANQKASYFQNGLTLNRHEAKIRLQNLTPGTEEHSKLQSALIRTTGIVEINLPHSSYKIDAHLDSRLLGGFGASEHVAIGEAIKLKGLPENTPLFIRGSTPVQFQQIVALAGDFYGIAGQAISLPGGTSQEKTKRFEKAFNTLAQADPNQLRKIILEVDQECAAVKHSSLPHHCYSSQMMEKNQAIKKIKNDIDELLIDNSDHFSIHAQDAYRIGHALALKEAKEAGQTKDLEKLKRAYAIEAFACHFLTDLFAAGHIRNQRGELESFLISQLGFSKGLAKKLAGILTAAQHEKDGHQGLNVSNKKGEHWRAYGDGNFFAPKNAENKEKVTTATQQSVDEIHQAYMNPGLNLASTVDLLIPHVTSFNPPPIYSVEKTSLFLYQSSDKIEIKTQLEYIKGLSQALRYLPQEYIDGFINPIEIQLPPILANVIVPQIERLTRVIWHTVGIASYHQLQQASTQLNEKIDEMSDIVKGTYENTIKILEQLKASNIQLTYLSWDNTFKEIKDSIASIKDAAHQYKFFKDALHQNQLKQAKKKLWDAYLRLSRVFSEGTTEGKGLLLAYKEILQKTAEMSPNEMKIALTIWFREMLDYQVQAFCMYGTLQVIESGLEGNDDLLKSQVLGFETSLLQQITANRDYIDSELIYENASYIRLQLDKSKTKRLALSQLKASN